MRIGVPGFRVTWMNSMREVEVGRVEVEVLVERVMRSCGAPHGCWSRRALWALLWFWLEVGQTYESIIRVALRRVLVVCFKVALFS